MGYTEGFFSFSTVLKFIQLIPQARHCSNHCKLICLQMMKKLFHNQTIVVGGGVSLDYVDDGCDNNDCSVQKVITEGLFC